MLEKDLLSQAHSPQMPSTMWEEVKLQLPDGTTKSVGSRFKTLSDAARRVIVP